MYKIYLAKRWKGNEVKVIVKLDAAIMKKGTNFGTWKKKENVKGFISKYQQLST